MKKYNVEISPCLLPFKGGVLAYRIWFTMEGGYRVASQPFYSLKEARQNKKKVYDYIMQGAK